MSTSLYYIQPSLASQGSALDFRLDSYILHIKTQHCSRCGRDHRTSQLFEVHVNPRMTGHSGAHRLLAVKERIKPGFPIGVSNLRPEESPCCHECISSIEGASEARPTQEQWKSDLQNRFVGFSVGSETAPKVRRASDATPSVSHPKNPTIRDL